MLMRAARATGADRKLAGQGFGGEKSFYCELLTGLAPSALQQCHWHKKNDIKKLARFSPCSSRPAGLKIAACEEQGGKLTLIWRECWSGRKLCAPEEWLDAQPEARQMLFS